MPPNIREEEIVELHEDPKEHPRPLNNRPITPLLLDKGNNDSYLIDDDVIVSSDWSSSGTGSPQQPSPHRSSDPKGYQTHHRSQSETSVVQVMHPTSEKKAKRRSVRNLFGLLKQVCH
jgi:hypothetical protein